MPTAQRARKVRRVKLERLGLKGQKVIKAIQDRRAIQGQRETQVLRVHRDRRASRATQVLPERLAQMQRLPERQLLLMPTPVHRPLL